MNLIDYLFILTLIFELLLGVGLSISFFYSKHRLWPPPKKGSWQYWYIHLSTESAILCFLVLCFFDWNTFLFSHWIWLIFGLCLMIFGLFFFLWALKILSLNKSLGLEAKLTTHGPYKYTRNPQYLGFNIFLLGAVLFFNSYFVSITGFIGIVLFLFTIFVEESWLKEQFKEEYHNYCKKSTKIYLKN